MTMTPDGTSKFVSIYLQSLFLPLDRVATPKTDIWNMLFPALTIT